jgi:hypothetical protein
MLRRRSGAISARKPTVCKTGAFFHACPGNRCWRGRDTRLLREFRCISGGPCTCGVPGVYLRYTWALSRRSWRVLARVRRRCRSCRLAETVHRQTGSYGGPRPGEEAARRAGMPGLGRMSGESLQPLRGASARMPAWPAGTARQGPGRRGNVAGRPRRACRPADAALVRYRHASRWPSPRRAGCGRPGTRSRANL